jgi:hypothetical protein
MQTQTYIHKPEFKVFFKFWLSISLLMLLLVTIFYLIVNDGEPFKSHLNSQWPILFVLPLLNAIIHAYGARKHTFTLSDVDGSAHVTLWAIELLQKNGMKVKSEHQNQTILEPAKGLAKWFGNKFGTELVTIEPTTNKIAITGKYKYIDIIDTKLKFGQVAFKK